jgi:hypothetical protein
MQEATFVTPTSPGLPHVRTGNHLLAQLSATERERLRPHMRDTVATVGTLLLSRSGGPTTDVFFPVECVVSIATAARDGVDVALIGREGCVIAGPPGMPAMFNAIVQVPGRLVAVDGQTFRALCEANADLRQAMDRWQSALLFQSQQIAACNAIHDVERRLCRWLLQFHERTQLHMLPVTQEMLANMLGVQRTTVTLVAHRLKNKGVLRQRRGRMELVNMSLLEQSACDCHLAIKHVCDAVMPTDGEPPADGHETTAPQQAGRAALRYAAPTP